MGSRSRGDKPLVILVSERSEREPRYLILQLLMILVTSGQRIMRARGFEVRVGDG